jgi:hypothetical protein
MRWHPHRRMSIVPPLNLYFRMLGLVLVLMPLVLTHQHLCNGRGILVSELVSFPLSLPLPIPWDLLGLDVRLWLHLTYAVMLNPKLIVMQPQPQSPRSHQPNHSPHQKPSKEANPHRSPITPEDIPRAKCLPTISKIVTCTVSDPRPEDGRKDTPYKRLQSKNRRRISTEQPYFCSYGSLETVLEDRLK